MRTIKSQSLSRRRPFHRERKGGWRGGRARVPDRIHRCRASDGAWSTHNYCHADGNGNITALVNAAGDLWAGCRCAPHGRYRAGTGALASTNALRFSSKPWIAFQNSASDGLYYYGYRWYDPYLQRWISRDPLAAGEAQLWLFRRFVASVPAEGLLGPAIYAYVVNDPLNSEDPDGRIIHSIILAGVAAITAWVIWKVYKAAKNSSQKASSAAEESKNIFDIAADPTTADCPQRARPAVDRGLGRMAPDLYDLMTAPGTLGGGPPSLAPRSDIEGLIHIGSSGSSPPPGSSLSLRTEGARTKICV